MKRVLLIWAALAAIIPGQSATACSLAYPFDYSPSREMDRAYGGYDVIIEGMLTELHTGFFGSSKTVDVIVSKVWKGDLKTGQKIAVTVKNAGTTCDYEFTLSKPVAMLLFLKKTGDEFSLWATMGSMDVGIGSKTYTIYAHELERITAQQPGKPR